MSYAKANRPTVLALVGKPNSGKTALFNRLTGSRQKVANYPGVTVERKEGRFTGADGRAFHLIDLPGTYSLRARSPDERITRDAVLGRISGLPAPDAVVCVIEATSLAMGLRLVLELKQTGLPLIVAVNMIDIATRQGFRYDLDELSRLLGVPVVASVAVRKGGLDALFGILEQLPEEGIKTASSWQEPDAASLRVLGREAAQLAASVTLEHGGPALTSYRIDRVLLHPLWGMLALFLIVFAMFQAVFSLAEWPMDAIDAAISGLGAYVQAHMEPSLFRGLLTDGIIAGVGSVIVFLPQILILFFFILLLEDTGYMARAAFLLDRAMGGVGLHGKAFIPLLSSFACAIPGIMATRTIEHKTDRLITILIAPLMTCSARLPVYALIIAAFIPDRTVGGVMGLQGLVMFALYAGGVISALLVAYVLKHVLLRTQSEPFLMELPGYKLPSVRNLAMGLLERAKIFLVRAGTTIFSLMVLVWVLSTFPYPPEGAEGPAIFYSVAGRIGAWLEPFFAPIGFSWQMVVALVPGLAAREVAVAALGTVYAVGDAGGGTGSLAHALAASWTLPSALSFLTWYVFAPQCLSTLAVVRRETNSALWPWVMFFYLTALAYLASFIVYRIALQLL